MENRAHPAAAGRATPGVGQRRPPAATTAGVTVDVERRLQQHNGEQPGGAKSTHGGRPWKLAKKHGPFLDRGEAQTIEHQLKRQRGAERLSWTP